MEQSDLIAWLNKQILLDKAAEERAGPENIQYWRGRVAAYRLVIEELQYTP